jgi:hypothetical protein
VDLWHTTVLAVTQAANQRDHVQPELVLGQRNRSFRLGPVRDVMARATHLFAAADLQSKPYRAR